MSATAPLIQNCFYLPDEAAAQQVNIYARCLAPAASNFMSFPVQALTCAR